MNLPCDLYSKMFRNTMLSLALVLAAFNYTPAHDVRAAMFEVYEESGQFRLEIRLDRADILNALNQGCGEDAYALSREEHNSLIEQYIYDRFWLKFNNNHGNYQLQHYTYTEDYVVVNGVFQNINTTDAIREIVVYNSCLVDLIERQSNIFRVKLYDKVRSFRLNKDRLQTIVSY